jgi:hypothetical protein
MKDFFSVNSFATLTGCSSIAWMMTNVLCGIFKWRQDISGLLISILIAFAAVYLTGQRKLEHWIIALFNGFLIYLTTVGGTSLIPKISSETASLAVKPQVGIMEAFSKPWTPDNNLVAMNTKLGIQNQNLQANDKKYSDQVSSLQKEKDMLFSEKQVLSEQISTVFSLAAKSNLSATEKIKQLRDLKVKNE